MIQPKNKKVGYFESARPHYRFFLAGRWRGGAAGEVDGAGGVKGWMRAGFSGLSIETVEKDQKPKAKKENNERTTISIAE
jgi:hypothetical protein